ncbi:ATP-binding protein [Leptothoe sp. PORK10 BA2]|uniref:ATP-binding protein n=1 Tax=Leptothoe sp. PORK10 BA2 TaxID=3110254 RepID=UPI002B1ECAE3|nr:ATP-binding protein [Leptothoe sp. PORK10 BA2]MEA5463547.1 ATP-binding protein [Leptothoe sp. PORK10 BA2]
MKSQELFSQIDTGEGVDLEFKSGKGGVPRSLWETYSAMANTDGGIIFLGIEQKGENIDLVGVPNANKILSDLWNTLNNRGKVSINLLAENDLRVIKIEGREDSIISMRVPRATRRQRPVFVEQNPLTGTYRRNYEGDYHCTQDEVGRLLADQSEEPADSAILENFGLEDLDDTSLKQYRQRFASLRPAHPWLSENDRGFLTKLGGWRRERSNGQEGLTVAGLLMFGRMETIQEPEAFPQYQLDYREKPADPSKIRWTDRITLDGTWAGNVFQFYQRVIQKLSADLRIPFQLGQDLIRRDDTIVHEAVREALVNALIHADYRGQGGVVIDKYPDRFEFSNPGSLLISMVQLLQGGVSECRNKSLQKMFQMIGGGEKAGSGIDKIRQGWASQHWRSPNVQEQMRPDRVRLVLPMISMLPEASIQVLKDQFGDAFETLNQEEVQALVTAELEGAVTNQRMQEICVRHSTDLTKILQRLVRRELLSAVGQGRGTRYTLPGREGYIPELFEPGATTALTPESSQRLRTDSSQSHVDSSQSLKDSSQSLKDSSQSLKDSSQSLGWDSSQSLEALPPADLSKLKSIAAPVREAKWLKKEQTQSVVLRLCEELYLTTAHLAELMSRNPISLRNRFLTPMVHNGLLELCYPDKPNRPDQAYRTVKATSKGGE